MEQSSDTNGQSSSSGPSVTQTGHKIEQKPVCPVRLKKKKRERGRKVVSARLKERERQKTQTKREQHGDRKRGRRETDEA